MVANEVPWAESGGARAIAEDGSLPGPFNLLLFSPAIGAAMLGVFRADKNHTSLPPRVHEIVILTVGAAWHAAYELYAHRAIGKAPGAARHHDRGNRRRGTARVRVRGRSVGLRLHEATDPQPRSRRRGLQPGGMLADFGDAGLVDMVMLIGLYLTVCATVNAFEVPVPLAAQPRGAAGDGAP